MCENVPLSAARQILQTRAEFLQLLRLIGECEKLWHLFAQRMQRIQQTFSMRELERWRLFDNVFRIEWRQRHELLQNIKYGFDLFGWFLQCTAVGAHFRKHFQQAQLHLILLLGGANNVPCADGQKFLRHVSNEFGRFHLRLLIAKETR